MYENTNLYKAIEQVNIVPAAKEMQLTDSTEQNFSDHYRQKIKGLINNTQKPYYPLIKTTFRKVICLIAAVLIMGTMTVAAIPALREWFVGLFITENENNADVVAVQGDIPANELTDSFVYNEPTFIPKGFKETDRISDEQNLVITYQNSENKIIVYNQGEIKDKYVIDTENSVVEHIDINGYDAVLSVDKRTSIIVWIDNHYSYCISGDLCKSDMISIANSVIPTK